MSIRYTIEREVAGDIVETEIEASGRFYHGDLESYTTTPELQLTPAEDAKIVELLCEEHADDWDEDKWQSEREAA